MKNNVFLFKFNNLTNSLADTIRLVCDSFDIAEERAQRGEFSEERKEMLLGSIEEALLILNVVLDDVNDK